MNQNIDILVERDMGGRRSGNERRCFTYSNHIPERRIDRDGRMSLERRKEKDRRRIIDFGRPMSQGSPEIDRRMAFR